MKKLSFICLIWASVVLLVACGRGNGEYETHEVYEPYTAYDETILYEPPYDIYETANVYEPSYLQVSADLTGFAADAVYLVELIEATHPIFVVDGWLGDDYEDIRDEFLEYALNPDITRFDFTFAAARYITTLRDGHMRWALRDSEDAWGFAIMGRPLAVSLEAQSDMLFMLDTDENGAVTRAQVTSVGGVPVADVFAVVYRYFYAENEPDHYFQRGWFTRYENIITRAGGEIAGDVVTVTIYENGETTIIEVPFRHIDDAVYVDDADFIIRYEIIDDIFLIDLRQFIDGEHITHTVTAIEQAIEDGINKFIVDLRDNPGGDSTAGSRLLQAMGLAVPHYGVIRRLSDVFFTTPILRDIYMHYLVQFTQGREYVRHEPLIHDDGNRHNVFVSVLTNTITYSSATMMGVWVQDGGFGNIIGSPSMNAPNCFGSWMGPVTLPYSGIAVWLSSSQFLRPDVNADPTTLWPDIMVDPAEALEVAIEYLRGLDR